MSYPQGGGLFPRWTSSSASTTACASASLSQHSLDQTRRQTWASATWARGQRLLSGNFYPRKDQNLLREQQQEQQQLIDSGNHSPARHHRLLEAPSIPRLLGNENLDEWDDILIRTLRLHGLAEYLTRPFPGVPEPSTATPWAHTKQPTHSDLSPDQWAQDRALVCLLITGSMSVDVRDTILAHGYDISETNPKVIYDLILEALPKAIGEDANGWIKELSSISPSEPRFGGSLRHYCLRLSYLRRRLYFAEPQPNDDLVLVMGILGLGKVKRYEDLSVVLGKELEDGGLAWSRFMGDLAGVHGREAAGRRKARRQMPDNSLLV